MACLAEGSPLMYGRRILILVPHPDDEVVACCAALGRARQAGAAIFALYLTHGCIARETRWPWQRNRHADYVAVRRAEAEQTAQFLGITPVGWSDRAARQLWCSLSEAYTEIVHAVAAHNIDQIWLPAYEGGNADHDGLNAIGQKLKGADLSVLEFAEYNFFGGKAQAQTFPYPNGTEQVLQLTVAEQAAKRAALALYRSEQGNLNYVGVTRECFRPLADYDYRQPPHPGTLWYARFQWVPFRHPRVDFTKSNEVSAAITEFLSTVS
jgi:LmbE family N-acetylglucosaminyl deacetylase